MQKQKVIKSMIISTWCILICCFIFKIFSNGLFEIIVKNQNFINFATYIDTRIWLQSLVYLPYVVIGNTLLLLAISEKHDKKTILIIVGCVLFEYLLRTLVLCFLPEYYISINLCLDSILIVIVPYFLNKNMITCVCGFTLNMGIQSVSILIRNLGIKVLVNDSITSMILAIDVILMYVLYFLYTNYKREDEYGSNS